MPICLNDHHVNLMSDPGYISGHPAPPTGLGGGKVTLTSGVPTSPPASGTGWAIDPATGIAYYWAPGSEEWETFAGGGGGDPETQRVYSNAGDPNGVVTATVVPAICIDTDNEGIIYVKTTGAGTNTDWT